MSSAPTPETPLILFRVGTALFAVPATTVDRIVPPPRHVTAAPGTSGLFRQDGEVASVVDLRRRLGGAEAPDAQRGRLLITHLHGAELGFWVDEVAGMARVEQGQWQPLPAYLPRGSFDGIFRHRETLVLCSDFARLRTLRNTGFLRHHPPLPTEKPATDDNTVSADTTAASTPPAQPAAKPEPARSRTPPAPRPPPATRPTAPKSAAHRPAVTTPAARRPAASPPPKPTPAADRGLPPRPAVTPPRRPAPAAPPAPAPRQVAAPPPPAAPRPAGSAPATTGSGGLYLTAVLTLLLLLFGGGLYLYLATGEGPQTPSFPPVQSSPPPAVAAAPTPMAASPVPPPATTEATRRASPPTATTPDAAAPPVSVARDADGVHIVIHRHRPTRSETPEATPQSGAGTPSPPVQVKPLAPTRPEASPATPATPADTTPAPTTHEPQPSPKRAVSHEAGSCADSRARCVIVHTVVRGDTLWDIASRYLHDPWQFKALARQSKIRDPDLIHPGEKVFIIIE